MATTLINPLYPRPHIAVGGSSIATGFMLTVGSSTASSFLTANFDSGCEIVYLDVQTVGVCVTFDGSTPAVGTNGHLFGVGAFIPLQRSAAIAAKFIGNAGAGKIYASQWSM